MNEIELLELILRQIGELRVPMKEEQLRKDLQVIAWNVQELINAKNGRMDGPETEKATEEAGEDVQGE